jgi:hypothetical protein
MTARFVRPLLAILTACVVWLVASPAQAAAPMCDQRGASMFAPAPTLQAPTTSIDLGMDHDDSCRAFVDTRVAFREGRAPLPESSPIQLEATLPTHVTVPNRPIAFLPRAYDAIDCARPGIHLRLDRPPRS